MRRQSGLAGFSALPRDARLYLGAEAFSALAAGAYVAVYNLYVVTLGFDTAFLGTLLVAGMAGAGLAVVPAGTLVDRVGARALLLGGSVVVAAGVGAQLAITTAPALLLGNAVAGAGAAAFSVAAAPFLARAGAGGHRNDLFSLDTAVTLAGTAVGSATAGQVAASLGAAGEGGPLAPVAAYRLTLFLGSAIGALSFVLLLATRGGRRGAAADAASGMLTAGAPAGAPEAEAAAAAEPAPAWGLVLRDAVALRLAVTTALIGLGAGLFLPFLNVYFVEVLGASPAAFGWISGAGTLTRLGATLLAPRIARRLGTAGAVATTQLASVPFLLLLGFTPQVGVAALAVLARGALMNMAMPLQTSFTMGALRPSLRGTGNALLLLVGNLARAASTLIGGALIERVGYRWPYVLTAALYALAAVLFWIWFGARRGDADGRRERAREADEVPG